MWYGFTYVRIKIQYIICAEFLETKEKNYTIDFTKILYLSPFSMSNSTSLKFNLLLHYYLKNKRRYVTKIVLLYNIDINEK